MVVFRQEIREDRLGVLTAWITGDGRGGLVMIYWGDEQVVSAVDAGPTVPAPPIVARLAPGGPSGVIHSGGRFAIGLCRD